MNRAGIVVALFAASCGASSAQRPIGYDVDDTRDGASEGMTPARKEVPEDAVARASGPVRALRLPAKTEISAQQIAQELLDADAICLGETHDSAAHHYAEVWLLERLAVRAKRRGLELGVGLEMFQQPYQHALSAYQRGDIDDEELVRRTHYEERWGYAYAYYRPLLERSRQFALALVALNADKALTRAVARDGIDGLSSDLERTLPDLDLHQAEHRADFERRMRNHPGLTPERLDHYYEAQVIWDEAMASRASGWLLEHAPVRRLVIVAGQAHCQQSAIPARIERRGPERVVSVLLATEEEAKQDVPSGFDFALVVGKP